MQSGTKKYGKKEMIKPVKKLESVFTEIEELITIIAKRIITAKTNNKLKGTN